MGGKHTRCSNEYASITLTLPKIGYSTGEVVVGDIQLHVQKGLQASFLDISIKGK